MAVAAYRSYTATRSDLERTGLTKEKTGVFTGALAVNPVNGQAIPVFVADYVLMGYGTGAIMAVPGQDQRDWDFAERFDLPIVRTVQPPEGFEEGGGKVGAALAGGMGRAEPEQVIEQRAAKRDLDRGGGTVGCELGQVLARYGAAVTIVEQHDRLLPAEEPEASDIVAAARRITAEGANDGPRR